MDKKINWGILSTAYIATEAVIPAMINSKYCEIKGIASRSYDKAKNVAKRFNIPKHFGSYQELLEDKEIEAVYIPLPNHMHVPWAIKALEAGKHVLLEKPVALNSSEAQKLLDESLKYPQLKIMEAFMYRFHPQWVKVKEMINNGEIGELKAIQSSFSFFDDDPNSIVNSKEYGGGSLMDIGCYPISLSRFLFESEPKNVSAAIEYHPEFKTDTIANGIMSFDKGSSIFFSSTLVTDNQQVEIFGIKGSIEFEIPFNPPADKPVKIWLNREGKKELIEFDNCDQYTIQADLFSMAIIQNTEVPTPLHDAVNNMLVIEKLKESDKTGKRINL